MRLIGVVSVVLRRGSIVRYREQWMAAYRAALPLAHANQLPLPRLQSAAVHESSHVSKYPGITFFTFESIVNDVTNRRAVGAFLPVSTGHEPLNRLR